MFDIKDIVACAEIMGLSVQNVSQCRVDVILTDEFTLIFENEPKDNDTIIYFDGGWHSHGDIMAETLGVSIQDVPGTIMEMLKAGNALLVAYYYTNGICERRLEFKHYISEITIKNLEAGERVEYQRMV